MAGMPKPLTPDESEAGWQSVYLEQQRAAQAAAAPAVPAPVIAKQAGFAPPAGATTYTSAAQIRAQVAKGALDPATGQQALQQAYGLDEHLGSPMYADQNDRAIARTAAAPMLPSPVDWIRNLVANTLPSRAAEAAPPMPPSTPGMAALQRGAVIPPELRKPMPTFFENAVNFFRGAPPIGSTASPRRDGGVRS